MTAVQNSKHPRLDALENAAKAKGRRSVAVAYPCSVDSLAAALAAHEDGVIEPILVGPVARIESCAQALQADLKHLRVVDTVDDPVAAAKTAVGLVNSKEADSLMKGSLHTDELLSAVVTREANLRTSRRMSHVFWFDIPAYHKPLMLTDAVVNISPKIKEKTDILRNVIDFAHAIGVQMPKIALLSAVETVNPHLQSSVDAAALSEAYQRGEFSGAIIDGPFAFDNAISKKAAEIKQIDSPVVGDPDIIMVPSLDVGNALYKSFVYMAGAECAGVILGARVPIILTSRADSRRARVASCALAQLSLA